MPTQGKPTIGSIQITLEEAVAIKMALDEFRTAVPPHITGNKLNEWRADKDMWETTRLDAIRKVNDLLVEDFDKHPIPVQG